MENLLIFSPSTANGHKNTAAKQPLTGAFCDPPVDEVTFHGAANKGTKPFLRLRPYAVKR